MKIGIALGLLTTPLMAQTTTGNLGIFCNDRTAFENAGGTPVAWEEDDTMLDTGIYLKMPISSVTNKYAYYDYFIGEGYEVWYDELGIDTYGFAYSVNDFYTRTQVQKDDRNQMDMILNLMYGSLNIGIRYVLNMALIDLNLNGSDRILWENEIANVNVKAGQSPTEATYNTGISWVLGNPSYVIDETTTTTKNYYTLGMAFDITTLLLKNDNYNEVNNFIVNDYATRNLIILVNTYSVSQIEFPNEEYATNVSHSMRFGVGAELANTRWQDGFNTGYNVGYQQGYNDAPKTETESTIQSMLGMIFNSIKRLTEVELLPGIKVITIIGIPIILTLITWVINWIRG